MSGLTKVSCLLATVAAFAVNGETVTNVRGQQRQDSKLVDIYYDLNATNSYSYKVDVEIVGRTVDVSASSFTGDVGDGILPGQDRHIVWDAGEDWPGKKGDVKAVITITKEEEELSKGKVQLWEGGPYWADRNIGANASWDAGLYFWWGDTKGYRPSSDGTFGFSFSWDNSAIYTYGKSFSELQSAGWVTSTEVLAQSHDAAHVKWGGSWRMPTRQEFRDLSSKCDWTWATKNGVNGYIVRGRGVYASRSIFLPAAGFGNGTSLVNAGLSGDYWPSDLYFLDSYHASYLCIYSSGHAIFSTDDVFRYYGRSVRPVQGFTTAETATGSSDWFYVDTAPESKTYTLTLNPNGGTYKDKTTVYTIPNATQTTKPTYGKAYYWRVGVPTRTGYTFNGWFTAKTGGTKVYDAKGEAVSGAYWDGSGSTAKWAYDGNVTVYAQWTPLADPVQGALDTMSLTFTSGGDAAWTRQTSISHDGSDAARSGGIGNRQESWLKTTVYGAGTFEFWWYVSSEADCDKLQFWVDGSVHKTISGTDGSWTKVSVELDIGTHELQWRYVKDYSYSEGSDAGFIDQVTWTLAALPYTLTANPNGGVLAGANFGANNGKSALGNVEVKYGKTSYSSLGKATRAGYTFNGWFTAKTGGKQVFDENGKCVTGTYWNSSKQWQYYGNLTVYAQWTPNEYTITFYPNGAGSTLSGKVFGDADGQSKTAKVKAVMGSVGNNTVGVAKRPGYTFLGWYNDRSAGVRAFDATGTFRSGRYWSASGVWKMDEDVKLYAQWKPISRKLKFYPNGSGATLYGAVFGSANGKSKTALLTVTYDSSANSVVGKARRAGYYFQGWFTDSTGGTRIYDSNGKAIAGNYWKANGSEKTWQAKSATELPLYAQWKKAPSSAPPTVENAASAVAVPTCEDGVTVDGVAYLPDGESFPVEVRVDADGFAVVELEDAVFCGYVADGVGELFSGDRTLYLTVSP